MSRLSIILLVLVSIYLLVCLLLYAFQEKLMFFPEKLDKDYKYSFPTIFEELFLTAQDGTTINALYFKVDRPKGVILYFHGNAGSLRGWGGIASDFTDSGYNILIPDYRGYGKSSGKLSEESLHSDAQLAYNYLLNRFPENEIVIYGRSLGSGIALKLAAETTPARVILEAPYYSFHDMGRRMAPFLPYSLIMRYSFRSDLYIKKVKSPVYILHGTADEVIPYESGLKLVTGNEGKIKHIPIKDGGHNDLAAFPEYHKHLKEILK